MWAEILSISVQAILWLCLILGALTLFEMLVEKWGSK